MLSNTYSQAQSYVVDYNRDECSDPLPVDSVGLIQFINFKGDLRQDLEVYFPQQRNKVRIDSVQTVRLNNSGNYSDFLPFLTSEDEYTKIVVQRPFYQEIYYDNAYPLALIYIGPNKIIRIIYKNCDKSEW